MIFVNRLQIDTQPFAKKKSASCISLLINFLLIWHLMVVSELVTFPLILAITQPLIWCRVFQVINFYWIFLISCDLKIVIMSSKNLILWCNPGFKMLPVSSAKNILTTGSRSFQIGTVGLWRSKGYKVISYQIWRLEKKFCRPTGVQPHVCSQGSSPGRFHHS